MFLSNANLLANRISNKNTCDHRRQARLSETNNRNAKPVKGAQCEFGGNCPQSIVNATGYDILKIKLSLMSLSVQSKMSVEPPGMPGPSSSKVTLWFVSMWLGPATDAPHVTFEISVAPDKIFLVADMIPRRYVTVCRVFALNQVR
jgi:hypothetical protein